jgi:hypothetical protein
MRIVEFVGQTNALSPPEGWDNLRDGPCGILPIRRELAAGEPPRMVSMWLPTEDELRLLNEGACVALNVVGAVHPPVALEVEKVEVLP